MSSRKVKSCGAKNKLLQKNGAQTLMRGLDLLEAASHDSLTTTEIASDVALSRSTAYRLLTALVQRGYLSYVAGTGYRLGPKIILLGTVAQSQTDIAEICRPYLINLGRSVPDTIILAILDDNSAVCIDSLPGRRRINIIAKVGDRIRLTTTSLGKALLLDKSDDYLRHKFILERECCQNTIALSDWLGKMKNYTTQGVVYETDVDEDQACCLAAPIRDATGQIIAVIGVSSAAHYLDDFQMMQYIDALKKVSAAVSTELGFRDPSTATGSKTILW